MHAAGDRRLLVHAREHPDIRGAAQRRPARNRHAPGRDRNRRPLGSCPPRLQPVGRASREPDLLAVRGPRRGPLGDGALWAMGPSFIARLAIGSGVAVFGQRNGYPPGGCESVAEFAGATYVISHSDILRLSPDAESGGAGRFTTLGITSSRFYSLLSLPRGLAIGHFHGLGLWSPSGMRPMTLSDDIVFRTCVSQSAPGTLLASQYNRVLSVDLQTGRSSVVADSLPDYGDSLADEPSGRLWIGTQSRGLFVANPGSAQCTPAAPRFGPLPTTGPTLVTRAGATVVALARGAAYYLDLKADRFRRVAGFPGGNPSAVSNSDSRGAVWVALEPDAGGHSPRLGR